MNSEKYLNQELDIVIDRPVGPKHPRYNYIYPVNYGYVPGTVSGDGEELDAYLLGVVRPEETYHGKCIAIIHRTNDDDDKLIVTPLDIDFTDEQIESQVNFQEKYFKHVLIRK